MSLMFGHDLDVASWVGDRLGVVFVPPYTSIGVLNKRGTLIGGLVFTDYNGANIEVTFYGPGCITKAGLQGMFAYVFTQLKCTRLTARTPRSNRAMRELLPRLGFHHECVQPRYYGRSKACDAFVHRMMDTECHWITRNEQQLTPAAA